MDVRQRLVGHSVARITRALKIEQPRASGVSLIYDPAAKTLRTYGVNAIPVAVT